MDREGFRLSRAAMVAIVLLRVAIGWHFLYEGVAKLQKPGWSAAGYLQQSRGVLADLFKWMAGNPNVLDVVNPLNMWGLTLIGLGLVLGCFTRLSAAAGMLIVLLFYFANPPFVGYFYSIPTEGNYLIVNKNLVEIAALAVVFFTGSGRVAGLDRIIRRLLRRPSAGA
jgi:thiosulfate dehydrogenase (quinone) large subunit